MVGATQALSSLRAQAVGDWEACGEFFYCREFLFDMAWGDFELASKRLACGTFGGPIAAVRDETKMVVLKSGSVQPVLRMLSASGAELGALLWERGTMVGMGWSAQQELVVVEASGKVTSYSLHGLKLSTEFSFGQEVESQGISQCVIYPTGIALLTKAHQLWCVDNFTEPRPRKLAAPSLTKPPNCMAVLDPEFTAGGVEVLIGTDTCVYNCDEHAAHEEPLHPPCAVVAIRPSPDGHFLALFTAEGRLLVMSVDMSKTLAEFETRSDEAPLQMEWCGGDAVVLLWEDIMLLVGPYGDCVRYSVEEPTILVSELDGLRIITGKQQELLRRVPECVVDVFRPGSTAPAALLWEARDAFEQRSARADKILRGMKDALAEAVESCMNAAGAVLRVPHQRALLKAAVFGRAFCSGLPPNQLHELCQKLRILNAIRDPAVGLPLTMAQLEALTLPVLISRLVNAHQHLLAHQISESIGSGADVVLLHWACAKISAVNSSSLTDAQLKDDIMNKLKGLPDIRFAAIAEHAQAVGRRKLAIKLLEEERSSSQQVPRLLGLWRPRDPTPGSVIADGDEDTLSKALSKAVESRDPDLVYLVLFHALKNLKWEDFWALVCRRSLPRSLFYKHCRIKDPELLEQTWTTVGQHGEVAAWRLRKALQQWHSTQQQRAAQQASSSTTSGSGTSSSQNKADFKADETAVTKLTTALADVGAKFGMNKESSWQTRSCQELTLLLKEQIKLEKETGQQRFLGLSVADTIRECLKMDNNKALHYKKLFGVSDKRWYWMKLQVLAAAHDWKAVDDFAAERKPPIGLEPFLETAKSHEAPREWQARLIQRMVDSKAKAEEYQRIDYQRDAAEIAAKLRDGDLFAKIQCAVSANSPAGLAIAQIKERFQSTFR